MDTSPAGLAGAAACFACATEDMLLAIQVYLLSIIANGKGSTGTGLQYVTYIVAPPAAPTNTALPAIAFDPTGNLSTLFWNTANNTWN